PLSQRRRTDDHGVPAAAEEVSGERMRAAYPRVSHAVIRSVTTAAASRWTQWPALGIVISVSSLSTHFHVSFNAPGRMYGSSRPCRISSGQRTGGYVISSLYGGRG